jgi:nicotinamide-nucleotide amidase
MKRPIQVLTNFLKDSQLTISFAESMTCGLIAHKFGTISGTSEILSGSIVCYSEEVKIKVLRVNKRLIEMHTAESQQVTDALAKNLKKIISTDIHAALTGLAAPGGSETKTKPVGTVFFSFIYKNKIYRLRKKFNGTPLQVKDKACDELFSFISSTMRKQLNKNSHGSKITSKIFGKAIR